MSRLKQKLSIPAERDNSIKTGVVVAFVGIASSDSLTFSDAFNKILQRICILFLHHAKN